VFGIQTYQPTPTTYKETYNPTPSSFTGLITDITDATDTTTEAPTPSATFDPTYSPTFQPTITARDWHGIEISIFLTTAIVAIAILVYFYWFRLEHDYKKDDGAPSAASTVTPEGERESSPLMYNGSSNSGGSSISKMKVIYAHLTSYGSKQLPRREPSFTVLCGRFTNLGNACWWEDSATDYSQWLRKG
jgi:hypothetical protein